jgi:hypothetical protein
MRRGFWIGLAILVAIIAIIVVLMTRGGEQEDGALNGANGAINGEGNGAQVDPASAAEVDRVLALLPKQFSMGGRTAIMDRQTITATARGEFSAREASTLPTQNENPVAYIERIMRIRMDRTEVREQSDAYEYAASFYPGNDGLVAFLNVANIPDDSIGQTEERFEFLYSGGSWNLDWYGERHFCRRPTPGRWQPVDELCI